MKTTNRKQVVLTFISLTLLVFVATGYGVLMAAQMQMPASGKSAAGPKTLTGMVSDSMCGAKHMAKDKSPADCTRLCVKQGTKYALVAGNKLYTLEGHEAELGALAGKRATVKGKVTGEKVTVESVAPAKEAVK